MLPRGFYIPCLFLSVREPAAYPAFEVCSAFIAAGCRILKGGFIAVDEGKITDLSEPLYGVGDICNGKTFFAL